MKQGSKDRRKTPRGGPDRRQANRNLSDGEQYYLLITRSGRRHDDPWYDRAGCWLENTFSRFEDWAEDKYGTHINIATGLGFIVACVMIFVYWRAGI